MTKTVIDVGFIATLFISALGWVYLFYLLGRCNELEALVNTLKEELARKPPLKNVLQLQPRIEHKRRD